jgi:hypothetical protein
MDRQDTGGSGKIGTPFKMPEIDGNEGRGPIVGVENVRIPAEGSAELEGRSGEEAETLHVVGEVGFGGDTVYAVSAEKALVLDKIGLDGGLWKYPSVQAGPGLART